MAKPLEKRIKGTYSPPFTPDIPGIIPETSQKARRRRANVYDAVAGTMKASNSKDCTD